MQISWTYQKHLIRSGTKEYVTIPVGRNENRHLMKCNIDFKKKAITVGMNIYSIGLNNQWKLNKTTIYRNESCGKPITLKPYEFLLD